MSERKKSKFVTVLKTTRTRALLSLGIVLGLTSVSTLAFWTDEAQLTTGTIQAGTLDIQLDGQNNVPSSTKLAITNMIPGESVAANVVVNRAANSIRFTYGATGLTTNGNALASSLRFKVFTGTAGSVTTPNGVRTQGCSTTTQIAGGAAGIALGTTATTLFTNRTALSTQDNQATPINDPLCVQAILPTDAPNAAQGLSTSATLTFTATQLN